MEGIEKMLEEVAGISAKEIKREIVDIAIDWTEIPYKREEVKELGSGKKGIVGI